MILAKKGMQFDAGSLQVTFQGSRRSTVLASLGSLLEHCHVCCEPKTGIVPFGHLVDQILHQPLY
jgi:hypothetical protein